jgi:hypothetical protein
MTTKHKPAKVNFPSMVVIITNLSTMFTLSYELDDIVFRMGGIPYFPPLSSKEIEVMEKLKSTLMKKLTKR